MPEEVSSKDRQRGYGHDMLGQTVPSMGSSNRKSTIANDTEELIGFWHDNVFCLLVMLCIVAKRYILPQECTSE